MKIKYNLVTIKFKIALSEASKRTFAYEQTIKSFRALQDLGILEVEYFDNREIEKVEDGKWGSLPLPVRLTIKNLLDELAEEDKIMNDIILLYPKLAEFHKTRSISLACEIADDLYKLYN